MTAKISFAIRPSTPSDIAAVDALLARSYPRLLKADYPPSVLVTALPLISRARPELFDTGTYFVAETDQQTLVGAGGWTRNGRRRSLGHIRHVVTNDAYLRQGIGAALMQHTLQTARLSGIVAFECLSTRTAEPFYRSVGFQTLGQINIQLAPGIQFPAIRMVLSLS